MRIALLSCILVTCLTACATQVFAGDDGLAPLDLPPPPGAEEETTTKPPAADATTETTTTTTDLDTLDLVVPPVETEPEKAPVPDPVSAVPESVSAAPVGQPGRIVGGRVNIRAGKSTNYEIIVTLNQDTPVTVFGRDGDWVKIAYPAGQFCYMSQRYIKGDIPVDIPEFGLERAVTGDRVALRARAWAGSTVVGYVNTGETVTVTGLRGNWVRVKPPASARAWVYGKYVAYSGEVATESTPATAGTDDNPQLDPNDKKTLTDIVRDAKHSDFSQKKMDYYRTIAERQRAELSRHREEIDKEVEDLEARLARIEAEAEQKKRALEQKRKQLLTPPTPEQPVGVYTGWIEYTGRIGRRPAAYRLVKGGEVLFLLRSAKYDLAQYQYKRVVVSGDVELAPGWEANVLVVNHLELAGKGALRLDVQTEAGELDSTAGAEDAGRIEERNTVVPTSEIKPVEEPVESWKDDEAFAPAEDGATLEEETELEGLVIEEDKTEDEETIHAPVELKPIKVEPDVTEYDRRYK